MHEPARLRIDPCDIAAVLRLERELGVSHALGQVLVRRGLAEPAAARAWLAAGERHDPAAFAGIADACALVLRHVADRTRITIHGDYDVDGVCSTAILVVVLRDLGADVDWFLPSRTEDGYGLSANTVARLAT
ncbi:MAG: single-stranded-DNA-specific exonuclease, partial [Solirubrobacteraceae bacterium]|nr:single-stranded-DNA-specific exonuclease [Solirubrobacteraceae bacterium]